MISYLKSLAVKAIEYHAKALVKQMALNERDIFHQIQKIATQEAVEYVRSNMPAVVGLKSDEVLLRYAIDKAPAEGLVLEFGVFKGRTIKVIAAATQRTVHGFDSFEGLPEDWVGWKQPAGYFALKGALPAVPANVVLHKGWFKDTLPGFVAGTDQPVAFAHIHCDLYSSTRDVFAALGNRIRPGTVLAFHEYLNYGGWRDHEFRAFQEFVKERDVKYKYLAYSSSEAGQVCLVIESIR